MRENAYQAQLIKTLRLRFPGCIILKNDANYMQGVPDLLVLWYDRWGMLEVKASEDEPFQPNQEYYLEQMDALSFAACIWPAIEEEVLDALQRQFEARRKTRVPKR